MIIGYYPGGGGNRYFQFLKNLEYSTLGIAYDGATDNCFIKSRGLYLDTLPTDKITGDILCHCVNYNRIVEAFGDQPVYLIRTNLKASLRREWSIKGKYRPMFQQDNSSYEKFVLEVFHAVKDPLWPSISSLSDFYLLPPNIKQEVDKQISCNLCHIQNNNMYVFLSSAFEAIVWHQELYNKYQFDVGQGTLIDIDNQDNDFAKLMRKELSFYEDNVLFNFAWDAYQKYGSTAPIIDLFKEFTNDQR